MLCRLVAACTTAPVPHPSAMTWCEEALRRFEGVSDSDSLTMYIPLMQTCVHLWWQQGQENSQLVEVLKNMKIRGIAIDVQTLTQAIHALDPRTETI